MAWQRSFRPLTGMLPKSFEEHGFVIGFSPPYGEAGVQRLRRFCGDKLKFEQLVTTGITTVFPSPCGDKLQDTDSIYCDLPPEFSSPLGDKLKCSGGDVWAAQATFPSPHRDKLK